MKWYKSNSLYIQMLAKTRGETVQTTQKFLDKHLSFHGVSGVFESMRRVADKGLKKIKKEKKAKL